MAGQQDPGGGERRVRLVPTPRFGRERHFLSGSGRHRIHDLPGQEGLADAGRAFDDQAGTGRRAPLHGVVHKIQRRLLDTAPVDHMTRIIARRPGGRPPWTPRFPRWYLAVVPAARPGTRPGLARRADRLTVILRGGPTAPASRRPSA